MSLKEILEDKKSPDLSTLNMEEAFEDGFTLGMFEVTDVSSYIPEEDATVYLDKAFEALEKLDGGFESEAFDIMAPIAEELNVAFEEDENKGAFQKILDFIMKIVNYIKDKVKAFGGLIAKAYMAIVAKIRNMYKSIEEMVAGRDEAVAVAEEKVTKAEEKVNEEVSKADNKPEAENVVKEVEAISKKEEDETVTKEEVKAVVEKAKTSGVENASDIAKAVKEKTKAEKDAELADKARGMLLGKLSDKKNKNSYFADNIEKALMVKANCPGSHGSDIDYTIEFIDNLISGKATEMGTSASVRMASLMGLSKELGNDAEFVCVNKTTSVWFKKGSSDNVTVVKYAVDFEAAKKNIDEIVSSIYPDPSNILGNVYGCQKVVETILPKLESAAKKIEKENINAAKKALKEKGKMSLEELKEVKGKTLAKNSAATALPYLAKAIISSNEALYELIVGFENHCRDMVNKELGKKVLEPYSAKLLK